MLNNFFRKFDQRRIQRSQGELNLSIKLSTQSESTSKRSSRHQRTYHTGTHLGDLHGLSKSKALQKTLECLERAKLQRGRLKLIVGKVSGNLSRTLLLVNLLTRSLGDCLSSLGRDFILEMESQFSSQSSLLWLRSELTWRKNEHTFGSHQSPIWSPFHPFPHSNRNELTAEVDSQNPGMLIVDLSKGLST